MTDAADLRAVVPPPPAHAPGREVLAATETVAGRVVLRAHHPASGRDPFAVQRFELAETGEVLEVARAWRVHEEVSLRHTARTRTTTVTAVLRRDQVEVSDGTGGSATPV